MLGELVSSAGNATVLGAWLGAVGYLLQIYFDFSGYSDMAIGLGRMFGFTFPENFDYPYLARSVTDFWRRWHQTLGSGSGTMSISRWAAAARPAPNGSAMLPSSGC